MKKYLLSLMIALLCSFNTYGQTTIPIFSVAHELFRTRVTNVKDIVSVLKKHKLATDKSWWEPEQFVYEFLKSYIYNGTNKSIQVTVGYSRVTHAVFTIEFSISDGYDYYSTFLSYLEKNGYEFQGSNMSEYHRELYENFDKGYRCGLTLYSNAALNILFVSKP